VAKNISWSVTANNSYLAVLGYLMEQDAFKAAQKLDNELIKRLNVLREFPASGILTKKRDARKLLLAKHYFIIYTELQDKIVVTAFIDARSNHPY
jgi:plasmid stabilization system protein ParE